MRRSNITVVKLGGSHGGSAHLAGWLDALAACGGRVAIVPGGGAFADAVRSAQPKIGFDDAAAHAMALLAMEQFGRALASLRPGFRMAASPAAIRRTLRDQRVPVWAPASMVLGAADVPASWDVTSDSLAAWLAGRIGARHLLLVKHGAASSGATPAADLAARGVVDPAFPHFLAACGAQARMAPPEDYAAACAAIRAGEEAGVRIVMHEQRLSRLDLTPWPRSQRRAGAGP
jgi:aspartokinase-like uncharacterized kinase